MTCSAAVHIMYDKFISLYGQIFESACIIEMGVIHLSKNINKRQHTLHAYT